MRDIVTPVTQEEVKTVIRRCLEQAALVNYQRLSEYAKLEGTFALFSGLSHLLVYFSGHVTSQLLASAHQRG